MIASLRNRRSPACRLRSRPARKSKNASRLRSSARRSCGIVPSIVCRGQTDALTVTERETRLFGIDECAFGNETNAINERVAGHIKTYLR